MELIFGILFFSLMAQSPAAGETRIAIVNAEADGISAQQKEETLDYIRKNLGVGPAASVLSASEIRQLLIQRSDVRKEVAKQRESQEKILEQVRQELEKARRLYLSSKFLESLQLLNKLWADLKRVPLVLTPDIPERILTMMAAAHFFEGDEQSAREKLRWLLDLSSNVVINERSYPPAFNEAFQEVKAEERFKNQELSLITNMQESRPIFLGRLMLSNQEGQDLRVSLPLGHPFLGGELLVIETPGFAPNVFPINAPPRQLQSEVIRDMIYSTNGVFQVLGSESASPQLESVAKRLSADLVLLLDLSKTLDEKEIARAQWLEIRTNRRSPVAEVTGNSAEQLKERLVLVLNSYLKVDGSLKTEPVFSRNNVDQQGFQSSSGSLYKKWWFWTLVGVGVAGLGTGGYFLFQGDDEVRFQVQAGNN